MTRFAKWFLAVGVGMIVLAIAEPAFAQQMSDTAAKSSRDAWMAIAAGFGLGIAAFGRVLGRISAAALVALLAKAILSRVPAERERLAGMDDLRLVLFRATGAHRLRAFRVAR